MHNGDSLKFVQFDLNMFSTDSPTFLASFRVMFAFLHWKAVFQSGCSYLSFVCVIWAQDDVTEAPVFPQMCACVCAWVWWRERSTDTPKSHRGSWRLRNTYSNHSLFLTVVFYVVKCIALGFWQQVLNELNVTVCLHLMAVLSWYQYHLSDLSMSFALFLALKSGHLRANPGCCFFFSV